MREGTGISPLPADLVTCTAVPLSAPPAEWCLRYTRTYPITRSARFPVRFTLGVHILCVDRCTVTCVIVIRHTYSFTALKIPCAPHFHPRPIPPALHLLKFYCLYGFATFRVPYSWNHRVRSASLSNMHLQFLQVISWFGSSLLFRTKCSLPGWTIVRLPFLLLKGVLVASMLAVGRRLRQTQSAF